MCGLGVLEHELRRGAGRLGPLKVGHHRRFGRLGFVALLTATGRVAVEARGPLGVELSLVGGAHRVVESSFDRGPQRRQLAPSLRGGGRRRWYRTGPCPVERTPGLGQFCFSARQFSGRRIKRECFALDLFELRAQTRRFGFEVREHVVGEQRATVALEAAAPLGEHARQASGPLAKLLGAHERVAEIESAVRAETSLSRDYLGVEMGELGLEVGLRAGMGGQLARQRGDAGLMTGDLSANQKDPQSPKLGDEIAMAAGGFGLAFERPQLATNLAQEVLHPHEVRLGGLQAALGALLAFAVLQDAGGLLHDRPALFGARVQHPVDLALRDDHVLLTPDTRVGEQLLDVEQTARHSVDGVLALTCAPKGAADRDLAEVDREQSRGVVDRELDLGPPERGLRGRARENDVVHLLAADRARRLGAEHPRDRVDHVALATAVRSDHDRDTRLELQRGGLGERLEALEGERSKKHVRNPTLTGASAQLWASRDDQTWH